MAEEFEKLSEKSSIQKIIKLKFFEKIKTFLFINPSATFDIIKSEKFRETFKYFLIVILIFSVLFSLLFGLFFGGILTFLGVSLKLFGAIKEGLINILGLGTAIFVLFFFISIFVILLVSVLISGLWINLWIYLVGGRKGIKQTLKALIYGNTPSFLFGWVPQASLFVWIWSLILQIIGLKQLHEISTKKAILGYILSFIIPILIISVLMVFVRLSG